MKVEIQELFSSSEFENIVEEKWVKQYQKNGKLQTDTKTAITVGKERQCVSERTVMNYLKELCRSRLLRKSKAGHYEKIMYDKSEKSNESDDKSSPRNCNG